MRAEIENRLFFLLSFSLWLTDRRFSPRHIGFAFARPSWADDYCRIVQCPYLFDEPVNSLAFDNQVLREPVRRSPRLLNQFLSDHLFFLVREMVAISSLSERIRSLMAVGGGADMDLEAASAQLRVSPTTLRRRLKSEGSTFQEIKDEVRLERAIHYLVERRFSVAETAELVGFSDPAAFSRAFKGWTGSSPSEFGARNLVH
jgi:AraC-like DNA-binding protein